MPSDRHRAQDCLRDIVDNIPRIERYTACLDQAGLEADEKGHDAVERCLQRVCEAVFRLGDQAETLLPGKPWRDMRGMGNRLRHAYGQIDAKILWNVVTERLSGLKTGVAAALDRLGRDATS